MPKVELISIGNELLSGNTINTNASWISVKMESIGLTVQWITTISDTHDEIIYALKTAATRADIVISTGGLGPTVDDITKNSICKFFETRLVLDNETLDRVEKMFQHRNIRMAEINRDQALVPESSTVLPNDFGTAPGMMFSRDNKFFFFLPGVPHEMKGLINNSILEILKDKFQLPEVKTILMRTTGIAESSLHELLAPVLDKYNHIPIAFLPKYTGVDIRLKYTRGSNEDKNKTNLMAQEIRALASRFIYTEDEKELQQVVGEYLQQNKQTMSVAESFTGGVIQDWITNIPGSSEYFPGGIIAYSNECKIDVLGVNPDTIEKYGAVSEQTVIEMAYGVKKIFQSDYALATTGIAGPSGATSVKPVGLSYIACVDKDQHQCKKYNFGTNRIINKMRGAVACLNMARKLILNLK